MNNNREEGRTQKREEQRRKEVRNRRERGSEREIAVLVQPLQTQNNQKHDVYRVLRAPAA